MPSLLKKLEKRGGTALLKVVEMVARNCPDDEITNLGDTLGGLIWRLSKRYRTVALSNLNYVYGAQMTPEEIEALARRVFSHFGRVGVEFFWADRATPKKIQSYISINETLRQTLDDTRWHGRGSILITAHFGNWELLGRSLNLAGYPLTVIARDSDDPAQTGLVNSIRERGGYRVISRGAPGSELMSVISRNEFLGILPDQNTLDNPVFVPFFGRLASVAQGVGLLACRAKCPVIVGFAVWNGSGYEARLKEVIQVPENGSLRDNILQVTEQFTLAIEQQIRKYPEQWLWFHNRWKKRPPEEEQP